MQSFEERQHFLSQHAHHQPVGPLFADLVEHIQRHSHGHAVFGVTRFMQILDHAIHTTQAHRGRKGLRSNACRLVAHQLFFVEQQQIGLTFDFFAVPALQRHQATYIGRQLLVIKGIDQSVIDQYVLTARFMFEFLHLFNQTLVSCQKA